MCVGQQLKNKTTKQSIHSQPFLDFLEELTVLQDGRVFYLPNDSNNITHFSIPLIFLSLHSSPLPSQIQSNLTYQSNSIHY